VVEPADSALLWLRRDLRLIDNHALYRALAHARCVFCVFVFDTEILDSLQDKADRRVEFIWHSLAEVHAVLTKHDSGLRVLHGCAREEIPALAAKLRVGTVFANHDYEPSAVSRDNAVRTALGERGIDFITCKDQVVFEKDEVLTKDGRPFSIFTAYKDAWLKRLTAGDLLAHPSEKNFGHLARVVDVERKIPSLESIGFARTNLSAWASPPARLVRQAYSTISWSVSIATTKLVIIRRLEALRICPCICASAPYRYAR
jgi:deoxyribodipyrimidine photo-lyase